MITFLGSTTKMQVQNLLIGYGLIQELGLCFQSFSILLCIFTIALYENFLFLLELLLRVRDHYFFKKFDLVFLSYIIFNLCLMLFKQLFLDLVFCFSNSIGILNFLVQSMLINYIHGLLTKLSGPSGTFLQALMVMSLLFLGIPELFLTMAFISIDLAKGRISYVVLVSVACWVQVVRYCACSK